jgi:hypothetical protein
VTEVLSGELREGDLVITDVTGGAPKASGGMPQRPPFGRF